MTAERNIIETVQHPRHRFETVTPEIAYTWLERNTCNRNVIQLVVDRYARDMKSGRWHLTGDPVYLRRAAFCVARLKVRRETGLGYERNWR